MKVPTRIETDRLALRTFTAGDLEPYLRFMLDPEATRYLDFTDEQRTEPGARELFAFVLQSYGGDDPVFALVIALKENDQFIGSCGMARLEDEEHVECYYSLLPEYWGHGYATEATKALLAYAFRELGILQVSAYASLDNPRSWRVAEKAGMTYGGIAQYRGNDFTGKMFSLSGPEFEAGAGS